MSTVEIDLARYEHRQAIEDAADAFWHRRYLSAREDLEAEWRVLVLKHPPHVDPNRADWHFYIIDAFSAVLSYEGGFTSRYEAMATGEDYMEKMIDTEARARADRSLS